MDRGRGGPGRFGGAWAWYALVALTVAGLVLVALNRGGSFFGVGRGPLDDVLTPAQRVINAPGALVASIGRGFSDHFRIVEENRRLREENERLRRWYELALAMRDKMERYEALLTLNPDLAADSVTARVVQEQRGPFVQGRLINAGHEDGVAAGQAALADRGLVGRVVSAGRSSARVLLLTDVNSRIPVMGDRNNARAILVGDNSARPRLALQLASHGLREGDRIVTSGDAGRLPRGLSVGVAYIDARGVWRVRLFAQDSPLDYVRVVRFIGDAAIAPPEAEDAEDADAPASRPVPERTPSATRERAALKRPGRAAL